MAGKRSELPFQEFIVLMALLTSMAAMSIDSMLPALSQIANDLGARQNEQQYVVSAFLLAFGLAQFLFGPLSDAWGRKPVIFIGVVIYIIGSIVCVQAGDFADMLLGRALQGVGAAAPRITTLALVRDVYKGDAMARVMSLVLVVFITVPVLAPFIGQGVLLIAEWRMIFVVLIAIGLIAALWFIIRQPETLPVDRRRPLSVSHLIWALGEIGRTPVTVGYILLSGLIFSAFVGYLSSAQQIFQETYAVGEAFPFYFGAFAIALGGASYFNARLVMKFGMRKLCRHALYGMVLLAGVFFMTVLAMDGVPPLYLFMGVMFPVFFCFGILFANLSALAMEPVGHIAGMGASAFGAASSLIAVPLGAAIGQQFDGTVLPLVGGFALFSLCCLALLLFIERKR